MSAIHDFVATQSGACARCSLSEGSRLHQHPLTAAEVAAAAEMGQIIAEGVRRSVEHALDYVTPVATLSPVLGRDMLAQIIAKLSTALEAS